MKAKRIWIAQHPQESDNCEISFYKPAEDSIMVYANLSSNKDEYVEYKEYLFIEIEEV